MNIENGTIEIKGDFVYVKKTVDGQIWRCAIPKEDTAQINRVLGDEAQQVLDELGQ